MRKRPDVERHAEARQLLTHGRRLMETLVPVSGGYRQDDGSASMATVGTQARHRHGIGETPGRIEGPYVVQARQEKKKAR